jgi:hypothetical protein
MNISLAQQNLTLENGQTFKRSSRHIVAILSILAALAAFEIFNFSTTSFALRTLFGNLTAIGMNWASLFAIAICCMDIAGIICLFLPTADPTRPKRDPRLFGAWLLAAGLNTWLTWRGISLAIAIRQAQIGWVVDVEILTRTLPIFMAFLIWLIRVLIIGSLSYPKSSVLEPDFNLEEPLNFHQGSETQTSAPFNMPLHEAALPFNQAFQPTRLDTIKREPTYRGIPVRYRTN